jgi:hypothetical protein
MTSTPSPTVDTASAAVPASTSVWTVFGHYLGGDEIHVQATPEVATRFLTARLGIDLSDECTCDFGCGPIWAQRDNPDNDTDGSFPTQPPALEETMGERTWEPESPRTRVYTADQVTAALPDRTTTEPTPGIWTVYGHYMGGAEVHVEAAPTVAAQYLTDHQVIDLNLMAEDGGSVWTLREGPNDDGTYNGQPWADDDVEVSLYSADRLTAQPITT